MLKRRPVRGWMLQNDSPQECKTKTTMNGIENRRVETRITSWQTV